MRKPKVENKYNLTMKKIKKLKVGDESQIKEPLFWRNNVINKLLKQYKHSCMAEWSYCCYGLYQNCWQEPYFEGNWDMSQERVDDVIRYVIDKTAKICRKDSRILYCKDNNEINIVIVARDVCKNDYLITFTNEEIE